VTSLPHTLLTWARALLGLILLACGALFAADNAHPVTLHLPWGPLDVPVYQVVFVALALGFFSGFLLVRAWALGLQLTLRRTQRDLERARVLPPVGGA
jgi:uncharacterized integral membrane protein